MSALLRNADASVAPRDFRQSLPSCPSGPQGMFCGEIAGKRAPGETAVKAMNKRIGKKKHRSARKLPLRAGLPSGWIFVLLGVVALGFQSFVVKPHFHIQGPAAPAVAVENIGWTLSPTTQPSTAGVEDNVETKGPSREDGPTNIDFSDCSMCQSGHQSGQFLRPTESATLLHSFAQFRPVEFIEDVASRTTVSFSWHIRAPPQA